MSGTVGIIAADTGRYSLFPVSLSGLWNPPNTQVDWQLGGDIATNRNHLVERSLERGSEWILFLDDDHTFPPLFLKQLLSHLPELAPVCASLYLQRQAPFSPIAYSHRTDEGMYVPVDLSQHEDSGLIPIHAAGASGMLIYSEVFRAIEKPWFQHGRVGRWDASEDLVFCEKAHEAGFPVMLDLGSRMGHLSAQAIWPAYTDGKWAVGFALADNFTLKVEMQTEVEVTG